MTTAADLRPHRWSDVEKKSYNAAVAFNRDGDTIGMRAFLRALPHEALVDLKYQLPVLLATVRDLVDNAPMPCPRCGHVEDLHRPIAIGRFCPGCYGRCTSVIVPVGAAQTVTVTDGETEVE